VVLRLITKLIIQHGIEGDATALTARRPCRSWSGSGSRERRGRGGRCCGGRSYGEGNRSDHAGVVFQRGLHDVVRDQVGRLYGSHIAVEKLTDFVEQNRPEQSPA